MIYKIPSMENVMVVKELKSELTWLLIDDVLYREFERYKGNSKRCEVAYKVVLLDRLYNCNLRMDVRKVAEQIIGLEIDRKLADDDPVRIVEELAKLKPPGARKRLGLVFSSKYCHFHQPKRFAIYDTFAKKALSRLFGKREGEYGDYGQFKFDIDRLISEVNPSLNYKDIDEYLWLYGQWLHYKNGKENELSAEIRDIIKDNEELFSKLEPKKK